MVKHFYLLCICSLLCLLVGCNSTGNKPDNTFNPYVEAFTSGKVSRYTPIYLVLNQEISEEVLTKVDQLPKAFRIEPEVKGTFIYENNHTVVFKPAQSFECNKTYTVTADLSKWFEVTDKDRSFSFSFTTFPLAFKAYQQSMDINPKNENNYDVVCSLFTPDREQPEMVESVINCSEKVEKQWKHSPDGRKHEVTLTVPATIERERIIHLSVGKNKLNLPEEDLLSITIPNQNDFKVYDVRLQHDPESYVEVVFTKKLDESQDMRGLAFLSDNKNETVQVDGNKLRLYPDAGRMGVLNVHVSKNLRSQSGLTLQEEVVQQVELEKLLPAVRFVSGGTIMPQDGQWVVPFQSVFLRGVEVRVIKVLERNIGQFLQVNQLDYQSDLTRVGRLVALQTIFLDEEDHDLTHWNTFGIDLKKMIEPEQGAIYRIELSFNKDLSVYPCEDSIKRSKEQILADDLIRFKKVSSQFDEGGYYYINSDQDWSVYNYKDVDNPCTPSFYFNKAIGKNVLVTDLGLIAKAGADNSMTVLVHNLLTTDPESGVKVKAYNYQQQLLTEGETDSKGSVLLNFTSGKPFYLIASKGNLRSYLRVDNGSSLSLSSFDVSGEEVQKGIKGFIYGERGVWRPGDTLHLSFMLHDKLQQLPDNHPIVMELYNPLGQLYLRKNQSKGMLGIYSFAFPTEADAPTGVWNVKVDVGGVSFSKRVRIETIKPNRLKIQLDLPNRTLMRGEAMNGKLHVEWLQGAVARHLKYDIKGTFIATPTQFKGYEKFCFDDPSRLFSSEESKLISGTVDENGNDVVHSTFELGNSAPGMLLGNLVTRVYEESGNFSLDSYRLLYAPYSRFAGIRTPQQGDAPLATDRSHTFEVASVDPQGYSQANVELEVKVYKGYWYWWWSSDRSMLANYMSDSYNKPIKTLTLYTDESGKSRFNLSFDREEWGTYYISVKDKQSKHATGAICYFDWPEMEGRRNREGGEEATMLTLKTDKEKYSPGENIVLTFPSAKGARAIVTVESGSKLLSVSEQECDGIETTMKVKVTPDMQPNAYIYVALLQPHGHVRNDLPIRLYGVVPVEVSSPESHLHPTIQAASEVKPESDYTVTVSERQGREMAYTLAIVDEGLLDLTRYQTPDPWKAFNGREALGVNTWDLYNQVMGAYGGRIEQLFSIGGDDALNKGPKAIVNRFKPVVQFDGPFLLKRGERKRHTYQMPNYQGRVKVMVIAGDGKAYGHADYTMMVRKPVMLLGTLPRVIGAGEEMVIPATVFATEDQVGSVSVSISCSSNMEVIGATEQQLYFDRKGDKQTSFRIRVKEQTGVGQVTLTAVGKGDRSVYASDITIRSIEETQWKRTPLTIEPSKSWKGKIALPGMDGTNRLSVEVSTLKPLNLTSRLSYLLDYPHGCIEQIVSKAFPQLYLNRLTSLSDKQQARAEATVKEVINRMRSYQTPDGAFAYWPGMSSSHAWGTAYAVHFLLQAEQMGYLVPALMKRNAIDNLRRVARGWKPQTGYYARAEEQTEAYRLYLLALAGKSEMGAMNRLKESASLSDATRWWLASAYAIAGRKDVATSLMKRTRDVYLYDEADDLTLGSEVRDLSVRLLTLCLLNRGDEATQLANQISDELASDEWMSTQTTAFALVAISSFRDRYPSDGSMQFEYRCEGKGETISTDKSIWTSSLLEDASGSVKSEIKNKGKSTLFVNFMSEGIPARGSIEPAAQGLSLAVSYLDSKGQPLDISSLRQGTNLTAMVTVYNTSSENYTNLVLTELFPAGWEILNTRFMEGAVATKDNGVSYQDIRDDRVYSYIDQLPAGRQVTLRIHLCAVYAGRFYLPPVICEAMYRHQVRANTGSRFVEVE